jgi:HEXXH motif-containing protein
MTRMEVDLPSAEMADFLRLIVPPITRRDKRLVLLQAHARRVLSLRRPAPAETLIHEFCHQKANLLSTADPLLKPGQGGQVFYSPLRPDARRLWGLLLGAHAFVNVNRYLQRVLLREDFSDKERARVQGIVARRLTHVDDMLRTVSLYAELPGRRAFSRLWLAPDLPRPWVGRPR